MRRLSAMLWTSDKAAVAPTVALSLFALLGVGGIAFDYARLAAMDTELQNAADQAALAAATQLDGTADAATRAVAAAQSLLSNQTRFANDGGTMTVATGQDITTRNAAGAIVSSGTRVTFYTTKAHAESDTNGFAVTAANAGTLAKFVKIDVTGRTANYVLTPVVEAISSGVIGAAATAGLNSAICKVPPLMICNPRPGTTFDADALKGIGIQVTGHGNDRSGTSSSNTAWGPGDFGFLAVGSTHNSDLVKALGFQDLVLKCYETTTGEVTTGNPQGVYDALNTRFDIYDFSSGNGTTLGACTATGTGSCPAARNVIKDLVKDDSTTNGNSCKIHTQGWKLPTQQFSPKAYASTQLAMDRLDSDLMIDAMGLPRDNCHYTSYGRACNLVNGTATTTSPSNKFGDGKWARGDYFNKFHSGRTPPNAGSMTRYETYLWELADPTRTTSGAAASATTTAKQFGAPVCSKGTIVPGTDRRVISVAVVNNCASLSGTSTTVVVGDWVDMFLVEPTLDARGNGSSKDSIYMEVIGKTRGTGTATQAAQTVRRDVPYLVR